MTYFVFLLALRRTICLFLRSTSADVSVLRRLNNYNVAQADNYFVPPLLYQGFAPVQANDLHPQLYNKIRLTEPCSSSLHKFPLFFETKRFLVMKQIYVDQAILDFD